MVSSGCISLSGLSVDSYVIEFARTKHKKTPVCLQSEPKTQAGNYIVKTVHHTPSGECWQ